MSNVKGGPKYTLFGFKPSNENIFERLNFMSTFEKTEKKFRVIQNLTPVNHQQNGLLEKQVVEIAANDEIYLFDHLSRLAKLEKQIGLEEFDIVGQELTYLKKHRPSLHGVMKEWESKKLKTEV